MIIRLLVTLCIILQAALSLDALTVSPTAGLSVLAPGSFEIECNSTVVSEFEWFKNGTPIANGGGVQIEKTSDRGSKLTILHSLSSHTAIYKCYNKQEPAHEFSVFVLKVTAHDQNLTATEMTIIQCLPEDLIDADMNVVTPSLVWLKNGAQFNADLEKRVTRHNDNFSLEIRKTKHADAARYDCVFEIQGTNLSQTVNLWDAPYIERKEKSKNMVEGDNLILQCRVSGHPKPVITWRRQLDNNENDAIEDIDKLFSDTSRIGTKPLDMENGVILDNGKLEIFSLEFDDRANYICSAENEWGTNNSTTLVRVKDKLAALWPFLAIVAEVIILCAIIFLYEKKRAKETDSDDDVAQQKSLNAQDHKSKDEVRQRK